MYLSSISSSNGTTKQTQPRASNEPPLKMPSLANARTAFIKTCVPQKFDGGIHAVTFQPKPTKKNEDRYVVQYWDDIDSGPPWLFLAVLDGEF